MKPLYLGLTITLLLFGRLACGQREGGLRLNQLQAVATHNSYKLAVDAGVMAQLMILDTNQARALDYAHPPLREQLDLGVLGLEIDLLFDPEGGRYAEPYGLKMQRSAGEQPTELDRAVMDRPGFKVLHVQDIDYRSSCATFMHCLKELSEWSGAHPRHLPIMVSINAKEGGIDRPGFVEALPFTDTAFAALDGEILSVFPPEQLLRPEEIRDTFATLRDAVRAGNWPEVEGLRGRFFFVLDGGTEQTAVYTSGHPSLNGRVMFVATDPVADEAAILFMNDPVGKEDEIEQRVQEGYLVRTRADAGTVEARLADYGRLRSAIGSGAHYISTDYERADPRFGNDYEVRLPQGRMVRCNPVTGGEVCTDPAID